MLNLRSETFPFSDLLKGPLLSDGPLLSGFNRKVKKTNVPFGEPLLSECHGSKAGFTFSVIINVSASN